MRVVTQRSAVLYAFVFWMHVTGAAAAKLETAPALPPPPVDASPAGRPEAAPAAPGTPANLEPGGALPPAMVRGKGGPPIPGYPMLCTKKTGKLIRAVPGLELTLRQLQAGQAQPALVTLRETVREMDECKRTLHLKEGKQCKASKRALRIGENGPQQPAFADAVCAAVKQSSPIVLDMNGNGSADVTSPDVTGDSGAFVAAGAVWFDVEGRGGRRRTEWLTPRKDGLLALDANGNGVVDSAAELFGDADGFADGYAKLALLDANHDGRLTGSELEKLSVWVDDGDGVCQPGELRKVADLGITSIAVTHHEYQSTFVRDGKTFAMWDWFPRGE